MRLGGRNVKEECIFCKIADGAIPSATIFENSDFRVILDVSPATRGHALILPKEHFNDIFDMDSDTAAKLFVLAAAVARAMKQVLKCDGLNVVQNNGEIAGQTVFHFHMHLIPRYKDDHVKLEWDHLIFAEEELAFIAAEIKKSI